MAIEFTAMEDMPTMQEDVTTPDTEVVEPTEDVTSEPVALELADNQDYKPEPETETVETEDVDPYSDLRTKAEQWDTWADRWARDPVAFMKAYMGALTPDQQAQLVAQHQQATAQAAAQTVPEGLTSDYEPATEAEVHYLKYAKTLEQVPAFASAVKQEFTLRDSYINDAMIRTSVLEAQVNALMDILDAKMPAADRKAIEQALGTGQVDYATAVEKNYKAALEKAVTTYKQAKKPRPSTPRNSSGDTYEIPKGEKDMVAIFKQLSR